MKSLLVPSILFLTGILLHAQTGAPVTFDQLNAAFNLDIWADDNLWDDEDAAVAARLHWPEESRTPRDASFRLYAASGARVLGARPYSLALYGEGGQAANISMVFANKGDAEGLADIQTDGAATANKRREDQQAIKNFKAVLQADSKAVVEALKAVLGEPKGDSFGVGRQSRETVKRWDWNGHAILVAAPRDEYLAVRIVPTDIADGARPPRKTDAELKLEAAARVEKRENGDVIITQIPMVDQGPKGFCVPATWERAMRYMGIPADMYVLAMAGNTGMGGGTSVEALASAARELITRQGRRLNSLPGSPSSRSVAGTIGKGLPIMWTMYVDDATEKDVTARTAERSNVSDWEAWKKSLDPARKAAKKITRDPQRGHVRMITGYNPNTKEIAISDSWGKRYEERWITDEEAAAISGRSLVVIDF